MTATFLPFFSAGCRRNDSRSLWPSQPRNAPALPMETASPLIPRIHLPSHWLSCGQTRPQTAGSAEDSAMISASLLDISFFYLLNEMPEYRWIPGIPRRILRSYSLSSGLPLPLPLPYYSQDILPQSLLHATFGSCSLTGTLLYISSICFH